MTKHDSWRVTVRAKAEHFDGAEFERLASGQLGLSREEAARLIVAGKVTPQMLGMTALAEFEDVGNLITTAGLNRITSLVIGAGGQALTNTACRLGVGNSNTAEAVGQTDLQASSGSGNRQFAVMAASYPQQSNGVMTFRAVFSTSVANFVWNEWCVDVGTPTVAAGTTVAALMLNRKVASLGTKTSTITATLTTTITLS